MASAEELKDQGNKAFALKEYKKAAKIYRDAIQIDTYNPILYSNRAQCFLHLQDYDRAYKDCVSGINLINSSNHNKEYCSIGEITISERYGFKRSTEME